MGAILSMMELAKLTLAEFGAAVVRDDLIEADERLGLFYAQLNTCIDGVDRLDDLLESLYGDA